MIEPGKNLSPSGQQRRDQILKLAVAEVTHRRYSRLERKVGAAVLAALIGTGTFFVRNQPAKLLPDRQEFAGRGVPSRPSLTNQLPAAIQIVQTNPSIVEQLSVGSTASHVKTINDDELLATLVDAGRPAGLIEINGKSKIVYR